MARGLNKVQIIGRLGREPEMRYTSEGKPVTNFSVATGGKWTDNNGQERDDTEWFRIEAWDRLAETCHQYLHKGDQVYIEGRLKTRKYTDKDNIERTSVDVVASNMLMLTPKGAGAGNAYGGEGDEEPAAPPPARTTARPVAETRPTAPTRPAAPAPATRSAAPPPRSGRNQPQPIAENEDDIPF
jgi:single-strand DNA-binding protein